MDISKATDLTPDYLEVGVVPHVPKVMFPTSMPTHRSTSSCKSRGVP